MIAFKGFNNNLACTMGKGIFQYEVGKSYTTKKAQCANTGFHCVEEPIEVLSWYRNSTSRYCIVEAMGDIHEDGYERISCTEIKIIRELTLLELALLECKFLQKHPNRKYSRHVQRNKGHADHEGFVIVRGKHPIASGNRGTYLFLLKENPNSSEIEEISVLEVDGEKIKPGRYYRPDGKETHECTKQSLGAREH